MAEIHKVIPRSGAWRATGGNRRYDWIGPDSTIPFAGHTFRAFDRWIKFTGFIRRIRRFFGLGENQAYRGAQTVEVGDCGLSLATRGMELTRDGSAYTGTLNVEGMIQEMRLEVVSATEMRETWSFSIGNESQLPEAQRQHLRRAGITLSKQIPMETHGTLTWRYTGEPDAPVEWTAHCCALMAGLHLWNQRMAAAYGDDALYESVMSSFPDSEILDPSFIKQKHADAVMTQASLDYAAIKHLVPSGIAVTRFLAKLSDLTMRKLRADTTGAKMFTPAAVTDTSGKVTVKAKVNRLVLDAVMEHESIHQTQRAELVQNWKALGYPSADDAVDIAYSDPDWYRPAEVEAYTLENQWIEAWLAEFCD